MGTEDELLRLAGAGLDPWDSVWVAHYFSFFESSHEQRRLFRDELKAGGLGVEPGERRDEGARRHPVKVHSRDSLQYALRLTVVQRGPLRDSRTGPTPTTSTNTIEAGPWTCKPGSPPRSNC